MVFNNSLLKKHYKLIVPITIIIFQVGCLGNNANLSGTDPFSVFDKKVEVFGVMIYGTPNTGIDKVKHAATVMSEYLDNNEDGVPDNPKVVNILSQRKATLIMFENENENDYFLEEVLFEWNDYLNDNYELQNLFDSETHPNGASRELFDATLEEVHHLILFGGYSYAYPEAFGYQNGTLVALAMDIARGGHFEEIPASYPKGAWYSYDDETCDYGCMIIEYLYWAHTSLLGAQDYPWRLEEIEHEWKLNSAHKLQTTDTAIYELLMNPEYVLAMNLPDGIYNGREILVEKN